MRYHLRFFSATLSLLVILPAYALELTTSPSSSNNAIVELSAEASRSAPNDLFRATVFAESTDVNSAALAKQVNRTMSSALHLIASYTNVKAQTGSSQTTPIYGKTQRLIEAWRMRSEIQLESRDASALAELVGKLQTTLTVSQLSVLPSPETQNKAESEAAVAALNAFRERAALVAATLGKKYRIRELSINNSGRQPAYPMLRMAKMAEASAAPMPIEAGDSQIQVNVSGKVELID